MGTQREFPIDPGWLSGDSSDQEENHWLHNALHKSMPPEERYATELERMLSERPDGIHSSAVPTLQDTKELKETLGAAIEALEPEERWIAERLLIERMSLRKAGAVLGCPKTTLARRRDVIRGKLIKTLAADPAIIEWVGQSEEALVLYSKALSHHPHK